MSQFMLVVNLHEHGTAEVQVSQRDNICSLFPSYLSDAFNDLSKAVLSLLQSPLSDSVTCSWQDEPGEYRWIFQRSGEEDVRIEILRFDNTFSRLPDERGESVFIAECSGLRLATQVKGQLQRLLNEFGEEGYRNRWRHLFPLQSFRQLEVYVQHMKHPFEAKIYI